MARVMTLAPTKLVARRRNEAIRSTREKRIQPYLLWRADNALLLASIVRRSPSHVLIWLAARQF
jgi:hypothetical protein